MDHTPAPKKGRPMTKDEVSLLVDLIAGTPNILTKETNAASNKVKDEAWLDLTSKFNSRTGFFPRTKEQLRLKWDNLKKKSRKRSQAIRLNQLKTGGGKPDYIPPDETLDKIVGILGVSCTGLEVPFGGDGTQPNDVPIDFEHIPETMQLEIPDHEIFIEEISTREETDTAKTAFIKKPFQGSVTKTLLKKSKGKENKRTEEAKERLYLSLADYYKKKTEIIQLEIDILKSQNNL